MYINPFVAGMLTVILTEAVLFIGYSMYLARKNK